MSIRIALLVAEHAHVPAASTAHRLIERYLDHKHPYLGGYRYAMQENLLRRQVSTRAGVVRCADTKKLPTVKILKLAWTLLLKNGTKLETLGKLERFSRGCAHGALINARVIAQVGAMAGQVRELLDFLTWISSFEGFTLRPTIASYS